MTDESNESAGVLAELRAVANSRRARLRAALAAGETIPVARSRFCDATALRVVGDAGPAEPPLLPGAHKSS